MTWFIEAILAAILLAIASLIEKKILQKEHALEFSVIFSICVALFSLPLLVTVHWQSMSALAVLTLFACSVCCTLSFYYSMKCVRHMDISVVSPWLAVGPALTALFAFIFLGEQLTRLQASGVVLLVVGAYILQSARGVSLRHPVRQAVSSPAFRYLAASLVLFACGDILARVLLTHFHLQPRLYFVIIEVLMAVEMVALLFWSPGKFSRINWNAQNIHLLLLFVALITVAHRVLQTEATAVAYVGLVSAIKRSSAFFVAIIGGELFHEQNLLRKICAAAIMIAGVVLVVLQ